MMFHVNGLRKLLYSIIVILHLKQGKVVPTSADFNFLVYVYLNPFNYIKLILMFWII